MSEETEGHYLTQRELFNELIKSRIQGAMTNELGRMFYLLASKYSNHRWFVRYYHLKTDLIAAGVEACCRSFTKYKPYKDKARVWDEETVLTFDHTVNNNCFAYFTTSIHNAFLSVLKAEYNQSNIMNKVKVDHGYDASFGYTDMIETQEAKEKEEREEEAKNHTAVMETLSFSDEQGWQRISNDATVENESSDRAGLVGDDDDEEVNNE